VLAGVATDSCILATAMDANMRDYPVWVPGDCTAAISSARKRDALETASVSFQIARGSGDGQQPWS
jgi:nicotinamidase-related amidase